MSYDDGKIEPGKVPESWCCVDCGVNTAPGCMNRADMEHSFRQLKAAGALAVEEGVPQKINNWSEVYAVHDKVWNAAGIDAFGGCLCIGCLEKRLGRKLRPKDFQRDHALNRGPGTPRLMDRRGQLPAPEEDAA